MSRNNGISLSTIEEIREAHDHLDWNCQRKVSLNRSALGSTYEQKPIPLFQNVT